MAKHNRKWKGKVSSTRKSKSKATPTMIRTKRKFTGVKVIRRANGQNLAFIRDNKVVYREKLKGSGYRNSKEDREQAFRLYKVNGTFNKNVKRYKGKNFVVYDETYEDKTAVNEFSRMRRELRYNREHDRTAPEGQKDLRQFLLDQKFQIRKKRKKTVFNRNTDAEGIVYGRQNRTVQILCTIYYRRGRSKKIYEVTAPSNKIGSSEAPDEKTARKQALTRALQRLNMNIDGEDSGYDGADTKAMLKYNAGVIDIVNVQWGVRRYDNR